MTSNIFREGVTDTGSEKVLAIVKAEIRDVAKDNLHFLNYEI